MITAKDSIKDNEWFV